MIIAAINSKGLRNFGGHPHMSNGHSGTKSIPAGFHAPQGSR
jgi:hypothetical protein